MARPKEIITIRPALRNLILNEKGVRNLFPLYSFFSFQGSALERANRVEAPPRYLIKCGVEAEPQVGPGVPGQSPGTRKPARRPTGRRAARYIKKPPGQWFSAAEGVWRTGGNGQEKTLCV
jgi:hypothetical protein